MANRNPSYSPRFSPRHNSSPTALHLSLSIPHSSPPPPRAQIPIQIRILPTASTETTYSLGSLTISVPHPPPSYRYYPEVSTYHFSRLNTEIGVAISSHLRALGHGELLNNTVHLYVIWDGEEGAEILKEASDMIHVLQRMSDRGWKDGFRVVICRGLKERPVRDSNWMLEKALESRGLEKLQKEKATSGADSGSQISQERKQCILKRWASVMC